MSSTIPDLAWYASTGLIVTLMSAIAALLGWGFTLLTKKFDELTNKLDHWIDEVAGVREKQAAHEARCEERHRRE